MEFVARFTYGTPTALLLATAVTCVFLSYCSIVVIYRLYFHPLAKFPGPFLGRCTTFYTWRGVLRQDRCVDTYRFLQKYGSPVRIAPDELMFADRTSHNDIYGQGSNPCLKNDDVYANLSATGTTNILIESDRHRHARLRRLVAHGFAQRALLDYESLVASKVDFLVDHILVPRASGGAFNFFPIISQHYLDIVSELSFGASFNTLKGEHPTALADIGAFFTIIPAAAILPVLRYLPLRSIREAYAGVERLKHAAREGVVKELQARRDGKQDATEKDAKTFLSYLVHARDSETGEHLTEAELVDNAVIFLVAGSGTTAVLTTYILYETGKRPEVRRKVVEEVRRAFPDPNKTPDFASAFKLPYLNCVVEETFRRWGSLTTAGLSRISPGKNIGGTFVPKGSRVTTSFYATARDPDTFPAPDEWIPERWLNPTAEMRNMSRPFSMGPRNCIGKHLAEIVLYMTLAKMFQKLEFVDDEGMNDETMRVKDLGVIVPHNECLLVRAIS